eukprot:3207089-Rhodomonas_salina.1
MRLGGVVVESMEACVLSSCSARSVASTEVWSHVQTNTNGTVNVTVSNKSQALAKLVGLKLGRMQSKVFSIVGMDMWEPKEDVKLHEQEFARPSSVVQLHATVQANLTSQPRICVLAPDDEMTAYMRAVKTEHPSWDITTVKTTVEPEGLPAAHESAAHESEWRYSDGAWAARRLQNVR